MPGGYIVRDANDRALTFVYARADESEVRHGHGPQRAIQTGVGPVEVSIAPDLAVGDGALGSTSLHST
jgi:hypothetical protein